MSWIHIQYGYFSLHRTVNSPHLKKPTNAILKTHCNIKSIKGENAPLSNNLHRLINISDVIGNLLFLTLHCSCLTPRNIYGRRTVFIVASPWPARMYIMISDSC
jgi:hypothetical protein